MDYSELKPPTPADAIPVIDLAGEGVVDEIGRACEEIGFFVVVNHGVDTDVLADMDTVTRAFFALSLDEKFRWESPTGNRFRGFSRGLSYVGSEAPPDLAETFEVARFDSSADLRAAGYGDAFANSLDPNIWPDEPALFRPVWKRYAAEMERLAARIMECCALALSLPADWFADKFDRQSSYLAANYYPPQLQAPLPGQLRRSAHTDIGSLTLLYQDSDVGGLEVEVRAGESSFARWLRVPVIPRSFVVNLGDMLAKWTNDRWVATPHRVVNPPAAAAGTARISIPFFQHPNLDALIECIPTCTGPGRPPKYQPVLAKDWADYCMSLTV